MRAIKNFEYYLKSDIVKRVKKDVERAKSLLIESKRKINSLKEKLQKIGIKDENANDYVEHCYDTIMILIRANLYAEGYSTSGQGAHEAEVSYMQILNFSEKEVQFTNQIRYFRNGILYYGTILNKEYALKVLKFFKEVYPKLIKILKRNKSINKIQQIKMKKL